MSEAVCDYPGHILIKMPSCEYGMDVAAARKLSESLERAITEAAKSRPCPHCGSDRSGTVRPLPEIFQVKCMNCGSTGPESLTPDMARQKWNLRRTQ